MNESARRDCFGKISQTGDKEQAASLAGGCLGLKKFNWRTHQELNLRKVPINTRKSRYMDTKRDTRIVSPPILLLKK